MIDEYTQVFICDHCGLDSGEFNTETGNHPNCEQLAALVRERDALRGVLQKMIDDDGLCDNDGRGCLCVMAAQEYFDNLPASGQRDYIK